MSEIVFIMVYGASATIAGFCMGVYSQKRRQSKREEQLEAIVAEVRYHAQVQDSIAAALQQAAAQRKEPA